MSSSNGGPRRAGPFLAIASTLVMLASACSATSVSVEGLPGLRQMARRLGSDVMARIAHGYVPGGSGEILLVPEPWNVLGNWTGGLRGTDDPRTTHSSPWSYHERVPLILYGPGFIRSGARPERPVDLADLAPTLAELMRFPFRAPNGRPLREALRPAARAPRAIVVVVYDGGGWNLLEQWPEAWPVQGQLAGAGTTYVNATIGSSPSLTAPVHSTIGTGAYPRVHGIPENTGRLPDGTIGDVYRNRADPFMQKRPTLADAWDRKNGDRPWVGMLGTEGWHLGMLGRGADGPGQERDVAVLWDHGRERFWTNEDRYRLPDYLPGPEDFRRRSLEADVTDGAIDGMWRGNVLSADTYAYTGTPAFASYQGDAAVQILRREPIGADRLTDLFFVEMKTTDVAGHVWNMLGPEIKDVLRAQDRFLGDLVDVLDHEVGRGRYVVAVTADHGQTPRPDATGGLRIDRGRLMDDVNDAFGDDVVEAVHPSDMYLDMETVRAEGLSVDAIARFVADYRYGDGLPDGADDDVPPDQAGRRVFAAALPGAFVRTLTERQIAALGPGRYPEGDLTTSPTIRLLPLRPRPDGAGPG